MKCDRCGVESENILLLNLKPIGYTTGKLDADWGDYEKLLKNGIHLCDSCAGLFMHYWMDNDYENNKTREIMELHEANAQKERINAGMAELIRNRNRRITELEEALSVVRKERDDNYTRLMDAMVTHRHAMLKMQDNYDKLRDTRDFAEREMLRLMTRKDYYKKQYEKLKGKRRKDYHD